MAINVQVQTKAEQQQEMQDIARLKAHELNNQAEKVEPAVSAIDRVGINMPEMTEDKAIAEELDKTPPANMNPNEGINRGVPSEVIQMRKDLQQQKADYRSQQQRDLEYIKPISSEPGWSQYQDNTADAFGQAINRADKFTKLFHDKLDDGSSIGGVWLDQPGTEAMESMNVNITDITNPQSGTPISKYSAKGILFDKFGFNAGIKNQNGQLVVDPNFAKVMGYITENNFVNSSTVEESGFEKQEDAVKDDPESVDRTGSAELGRKIYREWMRSKNYLDGKDPNDYSEEGVDQNQFEIIGTLGKEMYYLANPDMVDRITNSNEETGNKAVEFQLKPLGKARINASKAATPEYFQSQEIKPTSYPREVLDQGGRAGPTSRLRKKETTKVISNNQKQIEVGRKNMNSVAHVVDPKRRKIMMQLGVQALMEIKQNGTSPLGDLFDIGPKKLEYFQGELAKKQNENPGQQVDYDPQQEYNKHVSNFIKSLSTASLYSNKPNHLDFAWQHLQNRMHVEQTRFNPQGNKWLRFVTGPAKPSTWTVNDRSHADLMFKEQMAIHFLGAKNLLPNKRIEVFNQDWNSPNSKLRKIADSAASINETLMSADLDKEMTGLFAQVQTKNGTTNASPRLANTPNLSVPQDILNKAMHEGIEGLSLIEAAAELNTYSKGGRMSSFMSPEFDGKTHGPASNMAMLGIMSGAYRTGILRTAGATKNLDNFTVGDLLEQQGIDSTTEFAGGDLRDGMRDYMIDNGQAMIENVFDNDLVEPMWAILNEAVKDRVNFLKKPPMTLNYGQLLKNLRGTVETTVFSGDRATQIKNIIENARSDIESKSEADQSAEDVVIDFLHTIMADSINANMDPTVIEAGQLLRANNTIAMLSNEVMTIGNALGFDTYIGARQRSYTGEKAELYINNQGKRGKVGAVPLSESKPAGSAVREGRVGGWGRGRVIPAVVQGVDGAWMNKMFTKSWPKFKGTYMLPIMDAVKTDLSNARTAREEANKNWWETIQEYSYVDEVMGKWAPNAIDKFRKKLQGMDPNIKLPIDMESDYRGFGYLLDPDGPKGKPFKNLRDHIGDTIEFRPRKKGESIIEYEDKKDEAALMIARKIVPKLWSNPRTLSELSPAQMLNFFDRMVNYLDLKNRNAKTVSATKRRRKALFDKAKESQILQIDLG